MSKFSVNNFYVCLNIEWNHEDRIPIDPLCRYHIKDSKETDFLINMLYLQLQSPEL